MIEEAYVSFETAKLFKDKGFNQPLLTVYITDKEQKEGAFSHMAFSDDTVTNDYSKQIIICPTQQMITRWLREVYNIHVVAFCPIIDIDTKKLGVTYNVVISMLDNDCLAADTDIEDVEYKSYEDAIESGIKYCLNNLIK